MIAELVKAGKRFGVSAVSHKVISNLLESAVEAAGRTGVAMRCVQKIGQALPGGVDGDRRVRRQ